MTPSDAPAFELRILSGMHAGARAPLDGDDYTLGTLDDCDFVLADAGVQPRHARLSRGDSGWQLDWVADEGEEPGLAPARVEPGKAVPVGPIVIAVDAPDAPWPTLEQLVLVPHAPALEPSLPPPVVEPAPVQRIRWASRVRALLMRGALVSGTLTVASGFSALAFMAWASGPDQAPPLPAGAASVQQPAPAEPDSAQKIAIDAALKELGLTRRALIEPQGAGWLVRAVLVNDVEAESLSAALSRLQPRPALRLITVQDLRDEAFDLLHRMAPQQRDGIDIAHLGEGRFRIQGRMPTADERDKLMRALAAAFPQVHEWDNALLTSDEAAEKLLAQLRTHGWPIAGAWGQGTLDMEVQLAPRDVPQWERALLAAVRSYEVPFNARIAFVQTSVVQSPPAADQPPAEGALPFEVRSVVGGDMPYVILPGGRKLARGGMWQGWRLAGISADRAVFENGARRAIVPR
jgi:type III secretion protein D